MPESDLSRLLKNMSPELVPGSFVFTILPEEHHPELEVLASVKEAEGLSVVIAQVDADRMGLDYDFVAAWITLRVNSALEAVGLTAAVSSALTAEGISCNVIAGLNHDHLLVPVDEAGAAMSALRRLSVDPQ